MALTDVSSLEKSINPSGIIFVPGGDDFWGTGGGSWTKWTGDDSGSGGSIVEQDSQPNGGTSSFGYFLRQYELGNLSATQLFYELTKFGVELTPQQTDLITLLLDKEAKTDQYNRDISYIIDSFKATQEAGAQAGLNTSAYLMSQGASSGIGAGKTSTTGLEASNQLARDKFQAKVDMVRSMISMIGGMARAGIYGSSIYAARRSVSSLAGSASYDALRSFKQARSDVPSKSWDELLKELDNY